MNTKAQEPVSTDDAPQSLQLADWWPVLLVVALFFLSFVSARMAWWPFSGMTWSQRSEFGESFGVLSALFNGLAFAGLIITVFIQARELRLQRHQLTLQRVELQAQRGEAKRLADAQEEQTILNSISAFIAAETYSNRNSSASPSQTMVQAYRFLEGHLQRDMERIQARVTSETAALALQGNAPIVRNSTPR